MQAIAGLLTQPAGGIQGIGLLGQERGDFFGDFGSRTEEQ
jgi:hypothetical protein